MSLLPFLKESNWPTSKEPGEKVVNPSYDTQIEDHLIEELMIAVEKKDSSKLKDALIALIQHIKSEGNDVIS